MPIILNFLVSKLKFESILEAQSFQGLFRESGAYNAIGAIQKSYTN
jgi:hypothetical protein